VRQVILLSVLLAGLTGCAVGPRAEDQPIARQPRGAAVQLNTADGAIAGELLAVQDTAIVILTRAQRATLVPFRVILDGDAELAGGITRGGRVPAAHRLERLRLVSRFPQGLDPELQRALLTALGQAELEVMGQ